MKSGLADALAILLQPREAMRRILDSGRLRWMPQVILSAVLSSLTESKNRQAFRNPIVVDAVAGNAPTIILAILVGCGIVLLLFYGMSWIAWFAGRMFDGTGSPREVRSAMAWGLMPVIAVRTIQIPLMFTLAAPGIISVDALTCGTAAFLVGLGVVMAGWYLVVASLTLAEAHRISPFGGIATLILTWLSPVVLIVAALLAFL